MRCTVCCDERLVLINEALRLGCTLRDVADRFPGISKDSAGRHKKHLDGAPQRPATDSEPRSEMLAPVFGGSPNQGRADPLLDETERVRGKAWDLVDKAEGAQDLRTAVQALRIVPQTIELYATLTGRASMVGQINQIVVLMPQAMLSQPALAEQANVIDVEFTD